MENNIVRIALVSREAEDRHFYERLLQGELQVEIEAYSSLLHLQQEGRGHKFNGMIMDIFTLVTSSTDEKDFFFALQKAFPVMHVRRDSANNEFCCYAGTEIPNTTNARETLRKFISSECRNSPTRRIRRYPRRGLHLPIHLLPASESTPLSTILVNISQGGCFLIFPRDVPPKDQRIWVGIDSLEDMSPIPCAVRWRKNWREKDRSIVGLGVEFEHLSPQQMQEIGALIQKNGGDLVN